MPWWIMAVMALGLARGMEVVGFAPDESLRYHDAAKQLVVEAAGGPRAELAAFARSKLQRFKTMLRAAQGPLPLAALRQLLEEAIGADPTLGEAHGFLGLLARDQIFTDHREYFQRVFQPCLTALGIQHALPGEGVDPAVLLHQLATKQPLPDTPFGLVLFPHRLRHDTEQALYLAQRQLIPSSLARDIQRRYETVLREIDSQSVSHDTPYLLSVSQWNEIAPYYLRVLHIPVAPPITAGAINPALNFASIEQSYWSASPNFVVVDDFLSPAALQSLLDHSRTSIFLGQRPTFVANFLPEGLGSELLAQLVTEMRARMPTMFCSRHPLYSAWQFKYDDEVKSGIEAHADRATVNFNLYLSPDNGNDDPSSGGLDIWPVVPPDGWHVDDFNNAEDQAAVRALVGDAEPYRIAHKQNRAIIFQSELIHGSQPLQWRRGYGTRRINLTLLFGKMGESGLCDPKRQ